MHQMYTAQKGLLALFLKSVVVVLLWAALPLGASANKNYYHYTPDGKAYFELSKEKVLIRFQNEVPFERQQRLLAAEPLLKPLTAAMAIPSPKALLAELVKGSEEKEILALIERLNRMEQVVYANPFLVYTDGTSEAAQDRIAIKLKDAGDFTKMERIVAENKAVIIDKYAYDPLLYFIRVDKNSTGRAVELANKLAETGLFAAAEPDMLKLLKRFNTNDTNVGLQWSLNNTGSSSQYNGVNAGGVVGADMRVFQAWGISTGSSTIKIAIIDEGVDLVHPDLQANLLPGYDGTGLGSNGGPSGDDAHGTACAGIVAGVGNNSLGIAGVAYGCKIIPVRIAYSSGTSWVTTNAQIGTSIDWAWSNAGADVLSNSWGGGSSSTLINDPITRATTQGRGGLGSPVLFAAGNDNGANSYPATLTNVISVIAMSMCNQRKSTTSCDQETWWGSNYGTGADVAAPGVKIYTTDISGSAGYATGNYTPSFNGTSSATPNTSGVMALILSTNPSLTMTQARNILESTCDKVGGYTYTSGVSGQPNGTWSNDLGYGRVNAYTALQLANPVACTSPPAVGTTSVLPASACVTTTVSLSLSGVAFGSGQTYQWQSSPNNLSWTNISGATGLSATVTASATTYYRCNVTCSGQTTSSLSSLFTLNNATVSTFPYTQNFDAGSSLPCGWSVSDVNADGKTWAIGTTNPRSTTNNVTYSYSTTLAANDWLFSAPLSLTGGTSYRVRFWQRVRSSTFPEAIEVKFGTTASAAGMTSAAIYSGSGLVNTTYTERTGTFTPASTGLYYVGWRAFSNANMYDLNIDDVTIEVVASCGSPAVGGTASGPTTAVSGIAGSYTLTGWSGTSLNWQSSTDNGTSWNDISGATTATSSLSFSPGNVQVRARVSRTNCTDAFSNVISVTVAAQIGDNLTSPFVVTNMPYTATVSTASGSGFINDYTGTNNQSSPDVFYRFTTGPCTDSIKISSCGSSFDTYVHLLNAAGTNLTSSDDNGPLCTGTSGSIKYFVTPNTVYYAVFEGYQANTGTILVSISEVDNPIQTASISAGGPTTFCQGGSVTLTASAGASYLWSNGATSQSINATASGTYTVTVTNAAGCSASASQGVIVNNNPTPFALTGNGAYCTFPGSGAILFLSGSEAGVDYTFKYTAGATLATLSGTGSSLSTTATGSGTAYVIAQNASTGCQATMTGSVSVYPVMATTYYQDSDGDGFGNPSVEVQACLQMPGYVTDNTDCDDSNNNRNPAALEVCGNGIDDNCNGQTDEGCTVYKYYLDADGDTYGDPNVLVSSQDAEVPNGYSPNNLDCDDANPAINPSATEICNGVDDNCDGQIDNEIPALAAAISINGPAGVCRSTSGHVFSVDPVPGATAYIWTLPTGATGASTTNSITVAFSSTYNTGNICVRAINSCVQAASFCRSVVYFSAVPAIPGTISGLSIGTCPNTTQTYSIAPVANATSYTWTVSSTNMSIVSGQGTSTVSISFGPAFTTGTLYVKSTNCRGSSSNKTLSLTKSSAQPASVAGPLTAVCAGSTQSYSCPPVAGATTYTWTVPAGSVINSGQGTNAISVTFPTPFSSGSVGVTSGTGCMTSAVRTVTVRSIPSVPTVLTGQTLGVCGGSEQNYSTPASTTGATSYIWSVPAGATINSGQGTLAINVTMPASYATGTVSVAATNACGSSALKSITVRSLPSTPSSITGPTVGVCAGSTQTYTTAASTTGATFFTWTVPLGATINSGQGTNSISVTLPAGFSTGSVSVTAGNDCGSSTARTVTVKATASQPGTITGPSTNLCSGGTFGYSIAAVSGASGYTWTVPGGCTISADNGTSISLDVPAGFVSGNLSVVANTVCGSSTARTLALLRRPATPAAITGPSSVCASATGLVFSTTSVAGVTYNWSKPATVTLASGQGTASATMNWGTVAGSVSVTASNSCGTSSAVSKSVTITACRSIVEESLATEQPQAQVSIYPNPGSARFHLLLKGIEGEAAVEIFNMQGQKIQAFTTALAETELNLGHVPAGTYVVRFAARNHSQVLKLVKE